MADAKHAPVLLVKRNAGQLAHTYVAPDALAHWRSLGWRKATRAERRAYEHPRTLDVVCHGPAGAVKRETVRVHSVSDGVAWCEARDTDAIVRSREEHDARCIEAGRAGFVLATGMGVGRRSGWRVEREERR
jgi:hypothetical protein